MSLLTDLNKRIEKRQVERWDLQQRLDSMHAEAQALDAVIAELESFAKVVAKEEAGQEEPEIKLRRGSDVYQAREALRNIRRPAGTSEILTAMGKEDTKENRRSLSAQISWYARKNQIFTRPEPNVFGLREWEGKTSEQIEREAFLAEGDYEIRIASPEDLEALPLPEDEPDTKDQAH